MPNTPDPRSASLIGLHLDLAGASFRRDPAVRIHLDAERLAGFNDVIRSISPEAPSVDAALFERMARELRAEPARAASVRRRIDDLEGLKRMAADPAWRLPDMDAVRVEVALDYLARADDLIPDDTPDIGLLDDAIVIELAYRMLACELADYADFCRFRDAEAAVRGVTVSALDVDRRDWLAWRRATGEASPAGRAFSVSSGEGSFRVR